MKKFMLIVSICLLASSAFADNKPFQLSLFPEVAIHAKDTRIEGVTLNIWGENPQSAFALGFVNGSTGDSAGFSLGLFNYAQNYKGVEWAWVNVASGNFIGWQYGFFNYAGSFSGLQFGAVNFAQTAGSGLQIGFINIVAKNQWFSGLPNELAKGMIFVNWRFE